MKQHLFVIALAVFGTLFAQSQSRIQVIHNSADAAASSVDIFANGLPLISSLGFREATAFLDAPSGIPLDIAIAPAGAGLGAAVATFNDIVLAAGETYVVVANGIVSGSGYNPSPAFNLDIFSGAREAAGDGMTVDVLVAHGSTDASTVDVIETLVVDGTLINDFEYGTFAGYVELPVDNYRLAVTTPDQSITYAEYDVPLQDLMWGGRAVTVVASGFLSPFDNSNGPGFGLWVAVAEGGDLIPLPLSNPAPVFARVQIIHNSADGAAESVDIFANGDLLIPGLNFREATAFLDVPAGVDIVLDIAPAGAGIANTVATFNSIVLTEGETYVIIANGIVSGSGYNPSPDFTLDIYSGARETASMAGNVDVLAFHGSTDAPVVDILEVLQLDVTAIDDLAYGSFSSYLELPSNDYRLAVTTADQSVTVVTYDAPLASLGLTGSAITVVASGFLDPSNNSDGAAFGLWAALPTGGPLVALPVYTAPVATARIQVIHNSADAAAGSVDVFANGDLLFGNLSFREATAFTSVPAGVELDLAIAGAGAGVENAVATFNNVVLADGETYIIVANGIVSGTGYSPSPAFNLDIFPGAREVASNAGNVDVLAAHGSTDAPTVDVLEVLQLGITAIDDFQYGTFAGYLELPSNDYRLAVATADQSVIVATYDAPLATLGLTGAAVTVVASGFLDPSNNSGGAGFGLWVALASGGPLVALPLYVEPIPMARIQLIHNAADLAASSVDLFINGELAMSSLGFRTATAFMDLDATISYDLAVAPAGAGLENAVATFEGVSFEEDETYIVVANGIVSGSGYNPAPAFSLDIFSGAREVANDAENVDVLVLHGSTDAPTVDVVEDNLGLTLIDNISYPEFAGYLELGLANYVLNVTSEDGTVPYFSYNAPLATLGLQGQAITVLASGFLSPENNSNGPDFGLWVATANGGPLLELPSATARIQIIHNSPDPAAAVVDVYASGLFTDVINVQNLGFRQATPFVDVPANVEISVAIAGSDSQGPEDGIVSFNYTLEDGETYIITASGLVNTAGYTPEVPFSLEVFAGAREAAANSSDVDVLVFHGSTDAPAVDVEESNLNLSLITDFTYSEYAGYLSLGTADYVLGVAPAGGENLFLYGAPLEGLGLSGSAITVVASGFLDPSANQNGADFGLWVALASGGDLIPLPEYVVQPSARVQVIHNAADAAAATVDVYIESAFTAALEISDFNFRTATPFVDVISGTDVVISVAPAGSTGSEDAIAQFTVNLDASETYIVVANGIVSASGYNPVVPFNLDIFAGGREEASQAGNTDVLVYHGATDAPAVDVVEVGVGAGTIVSGIAYSEFQGYLELGTADYVLDVTAEGGSPVVASYAAPLEALGLEGAALTVLASGFLNPSNNSNGAVFGLWVALASGGDLIPLPIFISVEENELASGLKVYPNPANEMISLSGVINVPGTIWMTVVDASGREVMKETLNTGSGAMVRNLNVSMLGSGIYTMQLFNGEIREAVRFTIVK